MVIIVFMIVSVTAFTTASQCQCTDVATQSDCQNIRNCIWTNNCQLETCPSYLTETDCDKTSGCAWKNTGVCDNFTACPDYTVENKDQCYLKDQICAPPGVSKDGKYTCEAGTALCSNILDKVVCSGLIQTDSQVCYFIGNVCQAYDVHACSSITDEILCKQFKCSWTSGACTTGVCADQQTQESCTYVSANNIGNNIVCSWSGNACTEAIDATALTEINCLKNTGASFAWINSQCIECKIYSILLSALVILLQTIL